MLVIRYIPQPRLQSMLPFPEWNGSCAARIPVFWLILWVAETMIHCQVREPPAGPGADRFALGREGPLIYVLMEVPHLRPPFHLDALPVCIEK